MEQKEIRIPVIIGCGSDGAERVATMSLEQCARVISPTASPTGHAVIVKTLKGRFATPVYTIRLDRPKDPACGS